MTDELEQWRPVVGYEGLYEVSNLGRVRSIARSRTPGGILKFGHHSHGYLTVAPSKNGEQRQSLVQTLVLEAFVSARPRGMLGLHRDDDPTNNRVSNLYWGTKSQNAKDAIRNKRFIPPVTQQGEKNQNCKLSDSEVEAIRKAYNPHVRHGPNTKRGLAARYGVHARHIDRILTGAARKGC